MYILNRDVCTLLSGFCTQVYFVLYFMELLLSYVDMEFVYLYSGILFHVLDRAPW